MKVTIYIRRCKEKPTHFTMRTDFTAERDDTPRIGNLGLDIKNAIDKIIEDCEAQGGVVKVGRRESK